jgi:hypothetical protein
MFDAAPNLRVDLFDLFDQVLHLGCRYVWLPLWVCPLSVSVGLVSILVEVSAAMTVSSTQEPLFIDRTRSRSSRLMDAKIVLVRSHSSIQWRNRSRVAAGAPSPPCPSAENRESPGCRKSRPPRFIGKTEPLLQKQ